jgi:hypothetical protein
MFGKLKKQAQKFLGKSMHNLNKGSKFLGKITHGIRDGYHQGKKAVLTAANQVDSTFGLGGATKALAKSAIGALESNPYAVAGSTALKEVEAGNKALRDNVINNKQLKGFVQS